MGYFPIVLMKLFELYMFELDLKTIWDICRVYPADQSYICYIFYEIEYYDFIDYTLD